MGIVSFPLFGLESINLGGPESILLKFSVYPCIANRFWKGFFFVVVFSSYFWLEQGVHSKTD